MRIKFLIFLFSIWLTDAAIASVWKEQSERRARWHASFKPAPQVGREITEIEPQSKLKSAGLKVGDTLLAINGEVIRDGNHWWDLTYQLRAATPYRITYKRDGKVEHTEVSFSAAPPERYENATVEYGFITSDFGIRQRIITSYPKTKMTRTSAILVVGGLSCSSIEHLPGRRSNFVRGLRDLVDQSDMIVMRVEKPGVGDSDGRCSETDFETELNGYEVALKALLNNPRVDTNKVIVYGNSMGSALAPYLANKYRLNGVISDGSFYRSWFEHMLEIERRIQAMNGHDESEVSRRMNQAFIPLYYGMLIEKKSYQTVVNESPLLAKYNYHSGNHMYGRPMAFYHQMQDFDFAGEWAKLKAPVRVRWGENDWIMSEYDIDMIEQTLANSGNPNFTVLKVPELDHWFTLHDSALHSYQGKPGRWDSEISQILINWAKELNQ